ncbi:MAG: MerR family transcriptional regulator [Chitinophagaceae bacterium]|nr:MAG: MerR family transcriptional regulator [Chitinophagaceae bacterium]
MNKMIKNAFTITDLENLSGIKAHTLRVWERRYGIFSPLRETNNRRSYTEDDLVKLLNIKLLQQYGYKISKIGSFDAQKLESAVNNIVNERNSASHAVSAFKLAMMNFDQGLFFRTYDALLSEKPFSEVFHKSFIPLLEEVGLLWQARTITLAHEHFISFLIRQKLLVNIEKLQLRKRSAAARVFVLFLPEDEMHSLGLLYVHYLLTLQGHDSIFLGENITIESLEGIRSRFDELVYVSYFTVTPAGAELPEYLNKFKRALLDKSAELWVLGRQSAAVQEYGIDKIEGIGSMEALLNKV